MTVDITPTVLETIHSFDPKTGRPFTFNVEHVAELVPNGPSYPWNRQVVVRRPKGRVSYVLDLVLIGDVIVASSYPRRLC